MNKRGAKRLAYRLGASAIEANLGAGWPFTMLHDELAIIDGIRMEDESGNLTPDGKRLEAALYVLVEELMEKGSPGKRGVLADAS